MPEQVRLKRIKGCGKATPGSLQIDGHHFCFCIENTERIFPAGGYILQLTTTGKTMPDEYEGVAYEVVPVDGRTMIKGHVANFWNELEGCFAPNMDLTTSMEVSGKRSKIATRIFMDAMKDEDGNLADNVPFWVEEI